MLMHMCKKENPNTNNQKELLCCTQQQFQSL